GNPQNKDLAELGYPIRPFTEPRGRQIISLAARNLHIHLPDPFASEDFLLSPIYSLSLLHTSKPFAFTLHDLQENYYPENFSRWTRFWRHQVYTQLLRRTRYVICESDYVKNDIVRFFGLPAERAAVITAPPIRQFFAEQSAEQLQATRLRLQLPKKFLFYP